ncbi:hypothetical protein DF200_01315 [Bifidobacterium catulorum]|uniref:Uncharacterized protein n=1 Tax=Bifidobacterium catulorum TaxID=1630173 RepID=A0A2U2MUK4_9BIFI|nr:hypothetical protein DF200_01315 [Bifidobacterium catulorum]
MDVACSMVTGLRWSSHPSLHSYWDAGPGTSSPPHSFPGHELHAAMAEDGRDVESYATGTNIDDLRRSSNGEDQPKRPEM